MRVKPYVLRYWEQEFTQLKPMKRRGNRRYYQHHEVLLIRRIRELLYEQGFTISGARNRLTDASSHRSAESAAKKSSLPDGPDEIANHERLPTPSAASAPPAEAARFTLSSAQVRQELLSIRGLLLTT